jgi:hypothetical protein
MITSGIPPSQSWARQVRDKARSERPAAEHNDGKPPAETSVKSRPGPVSGMIGPPTARADGKINALETAELYGDRTEVNRCGAVGKPSSPHTGHRSAASPNALTALAHDNVM